MKGSEVSSDKHNKTVICLVMVPEDRAIVGKYEEHNGPAWVSSKDQSHAVLQLSLCTSFQQGAIP